MKKNRLAVTLPFLLIAFGLTLQGCYSKDSQIVKNENDNGSISPPIETPPKKETQIFSNGKVDYKGVSFNYNQKIFGNVEAQEFAESEYKDLNDKGDYVHPQYRSFYIFDKKQEQIGYVEVYPVKDFRRM